MNPSFFRRKQIAKFRNEIAHFVGCQSLAIERGWSDGSSWEPNIAQHRAKLAQQYGLAFREHHEISLRQFRTDHWQTLFAIQCPEARS